MTEQSARRWLPWVLIVGVLLVAIAVLVRPGASTAPTAVSTTTAAELVPAAPTTDLPVVTMAELPAEARATLALIAAGPPFPYRQDGQTFGNREGRLPPEPLGFYREFTVETPGSADRGARRVVAAEGGARFYTDDHYRSFRGVVQ